MISTIGAIAGLIIAIILIVKKVSPVYSLMLGAFVGGLIAGFGIPQTVQNMLKGVKDITPAVLRILSAGVLTGVLIKSGAAASIARSIIKTLGEKNVFLALALSTMILSAVGVFVDVAVITVAPIALMLGNKINCSRSALLFAMIGGAKCGNVISPNPNTIVAAENFGASLSSVMAFNIVPSILSLLIAVYVILPLIPKPKVLSGLYSEAAAAGPEANLPSFFASILGPLVAIMLLALKPVLGLSIDPLIALPAGGLVGLISTKTFKNASESLSFGLGKMSSVAVLLIGTGCLAGVIAASDMKNLLVSALSSMQGGGVLIAPISGILMAAATASTTAGATISSASFSGAVLAAGVSTAWGAAMVNASCTVLDHMPHGSFFYATGGSVSMAFKDRLRLIPYESAVGLSLTIFSIVWGLVV